MRSLKRMNCQGRIRLAGLFGLAILLLLAIPAAQAEGLSRLTLADLGQKDITVRAIFDQVYVHFPLAEGRQIERAVLKLHLSHGKKLLSQSSDLIIAVNDEPAASLPLTPENAEASSIEIDLPTEALRPGDNVLLFRFNLRLRDTGCGDAGAPGLWAKVWADSVLEFDGHDAPIVPDLARFPAPFDTLTILAGPQAAIVLPNWPTPAELTAAVQIAAALGQAADWADPPLRALTFDQLDEAGAADDHLIAIDTAGRNPLAQGATSGLSVGASPRNPNRLLLVVSGADDAALLQAADLLTTRSARSHLLGAQVAPVPVATQALPTPPTRATFEELSFSDQRVRGIGLHDLYYPIDVPYDWKITSDAAIELRFGHARGLDSTFSLMSAFVNGLKVADVPLTNRNAADGRLVVQLSPRQLHPGRNWLHLAFDLHLPREDCGNRYLEDAWASVPATASVMNLSHVRSKPPLDLSYLAASLALPADLSADLFVLPAHPTAVELTTMVVLAAKLGTYSRADGLRPRATTAERFNPARSASDQVIAIGQPETNVLLAKYDARLPQPLRRVDGTIRPSPGRELLPDEISSQAGYVEILRAPWSRSGALIVVSAFGEEQLAATVDAWPARHGRWRVQGNVAVVAAGQVTGLEIGRLAEVPLSAPMRGALASILAGAAIAIGGVGLTSARRRRTTEQEAKDAGD